MMQCNLFAVREANLVPKLATQALAARVTAEQPAFPIQYSNADVPEWKEQGARESVIKPAFVFVPFSSQMNCMQLLPLLTLVQTVPKWISVIREEFKLQIDFSSHWLLTLHELSERGLHCQWDTDYFFLNKQFIHILIFAVSHWTSTIRGYIWSLKKKLLIAGLCI